MTLTDTLNRPLRDLRISVTDRCNFRCVYCMPKEIFGPDHQFLHRDQILTFEEITRLARIFAAHGVRKIRLTGGEPLVRKDLPDLISMLAEIPELDLTLTTNGSLLPKHARALKDAGLKRVTVSLDSLDNAIFKSMNDVDFPVEKVLEGMEAAQKIGFPLVIRPSYTLGGSGGGFVHRMEEFDEALRRGLNASPTHEVLVEKAVLGWKEFELELLRDHNDNVVIICTVENLDPMGIHTGDSITVAPAMTLSDTAYQHMRNCAMKLMRSLGNFSGGCNVQFAQNPENEDLIVVEINPRVSRSSALASKATGYAIAKIADKLAIGYSLDEQKNHITKTTAAFFAPSLDDVVLTMHRWNL